MNPAAVAPIGTVPRLPTVSAFDLCREDLGEVEWHLPGLIPAGAFVVPYGPPKCGKTTLCMHMAASLAGAQEFLDGRGLLNVLWLDLEQPRRVTQRRLHEVHAHTAVADFQVYQGAPPSLGELFAAIDTLKPHVVFVDSLSRWLRLESENDNAELTRTLGPILTGFQARDVSLVAIHHDRKSEGEGGRNLRGASGLLAMCDVAIEVRVEGDGNSTRRRLNIVSRHEGMRQMLVRLTDRGFVDEGSPVEHREREILAALADGPEACATLQTTFHLTAKAMRTHLDALVHRGRIMRSGAGKKGDPFVYALTGIVGHSGKSENHSKPTDSGIPFPSLRRERIPESESQSQRVL
jgi:archaellum biogenesis ATPase FlaH